MEKATRKHLAEVAKKAAQTPFHGYIEGKESNLEPILKLLFPVGNFRCDEKPIGPMALRRDRRNRPGGNLRCDGTKEMRIDGK